MGKYNYAEFIKAKVEDESEDAIGHSDHVMVVVDGATDKSGRKWENRSGGAIIAEVVKNVCLSSECSGKELIDEINQAIRQTYHRLGNHQAETEGIFRFSAAFVCIRVLDKGIVITQVGDVGYRINGKDAKPNPKLVDVLSAKARKHYIKLTGDVAGSRDYIMPLLKNQFTYQNNPDHPLGYGFLDGWEIPEKFINRLELPYLPEHIEIFTDGYFGFPEIPSGSEPTIDLWEQYRTRVEDEDPQKIGKFEYSASTKTNDDRAVLIAKLKDAPRRGRD